MFSFGDERKRKINLGGNSSSTSHTAILQRVQNERLVRQEQKRRTDGAIAIQAWYRGLREARETRREMKAAFERDVLGINGLRCLVLIGKHEEVLGQWVRAVLEGGEGELFTSDAKLELTGIMSSTNILPCFRGSCDELAGSRSPGESLAPAVRWHRPFVSPFSRRYSPC